MSISDWLLVVIIFILIMGIYGLYRFFKLINEDAPRPLSKDEIADISRTIKEREKAKDRNNG